MADNIEEKIQKAATTLATMLDYLGLEATIKSKEKNNRIYLTAVSEDAGRIIGRRGKTLEDLQLLINKMTQKGDDTSPKIVIDVDGYSKKPDRRDEKEGGGDGSRSEGRSGESTERRPEERSEGRSERRRSEGRSEGRSDRRSEGRSDRRERPQRERRFSRDDEGGGASEAEREEQVKQQSLDAAKEVKKWGEPVTLPPMNSKDRRVVHVTLQEDTEILTESKEGDNSALKSVVISLKCN